MAEHNTKLSIFTELLEALVENPEILYETPVRKLADIAIRLQLLGRRKDNARY